MTNFILKALVLIGIVIAALLMSLETEPVTFETLGMYVETNLGFIVIVLLLALALLSLSCKIVRGIINVPGKVLSKLQFKDSDAIWYLSNLFIAISNKDPKESGRLINKLSARRINPNLYKLLHTQVLSLKEDIAYENSLKHLAENPALSAYALNSLCLLKLDNGNWKEALVYSARLAGIQENKPEAMEYKTKALIYWEKWGELPFEQFTMFLSKEKAMGLRMLASYKIAERYLKQGDSKSAKDLIADLKPGLSLGILPYMLLAVKIYLTNKDFEQATKFLAKYCGEHVNDCFLEKALLLFEENLDPQSLILILEKLSKTLSKHSVTLNIFKIRAHANLNHIDKVKDLLSNILENGNLNSSLSVALEASMSHDYQLVIQGIAQALIRETSKERSYYLNMHDWEIVTNPKEIKEAKLIATI